MSSSHQSGVRGLEKLPCLKYNVLKRENRLTLRLNAAKNTDYTKKILKWKLLRIQFPTKNWEGAYVYLPQCEARGLERLPCLKYYNVLKWENRLNWILNNFYEKLFFIWSIFLAVLSLKVNLFSCYSIL